MKLKNSLRIKGEVEKNVTVIQSTGFPQDENLIELLFILRTLKDLGAEHIKVVVPYLGYGRQELRFKDGEAISAQLVSNLIEESGADEFISINLHEDSVRDFKIASEISSTFQLQTFLLWLQLQNTLLIKWKIL